MLSIIASAVKRFSATRSTAVKNMLNSNGSNGASTPPCPKTLLPVEHIRALAIIQPHAYLPAVMELADNGEHSRWYAIFPELHANLFSRHASPLEVYVFVAVTSRGDDVMSDEILSVQWKAAIKEAEWPTCAAPRLVYDSALFFETCLHVYVRTTYDQIYSVKIKSTPPKNRNTTCI